MPKPSRHTLNWSQESHCYIWSVQGQREQVFPSEAVDAWQNQLATITSFAFRGAAGHLNVHQETRRKAGCYWYASQKSGKYTRKRYLGQPANVTFARLEAIASELQPDVSPPDPNASESRADLPLLAPSLVPPLLRAGLVVRERLLVRLDVAHSRRLTLLAASAGWGKTTLLSLWVARSRVSVAWLSLSELENDPVRFWVAMIAAFRHSSAATSLPGERSLTLLRSPRPAPLETILGLLIQDLSARQPSPLFLVLDDYQLIEEQAIHDALLFLLEHLPVHLHLVVASRTNPPLALARWRARGMLLELRDTDLRFQEDEAGQFLTQTMALSLAHSEITMLTQRTEGWIAGLHLAALALAQTTDHASFIHGFAGSHHYLVDYVREEILTHLDPLLQDFVLHCAILSRLSAPLCQAITEQAHRETCQQLLEQVERANLFLVPLDAERRWYRWHDLFREALLTCLHATRPALVSSLHCRAASWYEQQGDWSEAISHRLAAADYPGAAQVMKQTAEQFWLHGEIKVLAGWIMLLPDEVMRQHASFVLKAAWYLLNSYAHTTKVQFGPVHAQVERLLVRLEKAAPWIAGVQQGQMQQRIQQVRLMGEIYEAEAHYDLERLTFLTQQGMQVSQEDDDLFWQMIPLGNAFVYSFTLQQAGGMTLLPQLLEMQQRMRQADDSYALLKVTQWIVLISRQAGLLHQTYRESLQGLALLEQNKGHAQLAGYFSMGLAYALFAWNRLDEARGVLHQMIRDATAWQQMDQLMWASVVLAELEIAAGNLQAAREVLQEESFTRLEEKGHYQFWQTSTQVQLWLAEGKLTEAQAWAAHVTFRPAAWIPQQTTGILTLLRVYLAGQQSDQALDLLEMFREQLDRPGNREDTLLFLAFSATALQLAGKQEQARAAALRLLHLTRQEGYLRVYLDQGEPMRQLLHSLLEVAPQRDDAGISVPGAYLATLLAAFAEDRNQAASASTEAYASLLPFAARLSAQYMLREPLTAQEQRVLQLLAAGDSTQAIAEHLVVSLNTVKTHLRNLYGKLQVNSRTQAIARARDLEL